MILIDELIDYVKNHETIEIIKTNLTRFFGVDDTYDFKQLQDLYQSAEFNELNKPLSYFEDCIEDIRTNCEQYKMIYDKYLVDDFSKDVFTKMLYAKVFMDTEFIGNAYSDEAIYFSETIWKELRSEAYIDCGGYVGDTVLHYIIRKPDYSNIYVYEPLQEAYEKCCGELDFFIKDGNVKIFPNAVSSQEMELSFSGGNKDGDSKISSDGELLIRGIALDHVIKEPVGFIKMDIEGSEKEALWGAKNIIQKYQPQMAICIYHLKDDFWRIPQTVLEICPEYRFMIRQHDPQCYAETVLYCIPKMEKTEERSAYLSKCDYKKLFSRLNRAIQKMVICSKDEYKTIMDPMQAKPWWISQIRQRTLSYEVLKAWTEELQKGNSWLSEKREEDLKTIQRDNEIYDNQQSWIHHLEQENSELRERVAQLTEYIKSTDCCHYDC